MAKAAPKKQANSARRKVQASTVRNRKDVARGSKSGVCESKTTARASKSRVGESTNEVRASKSSARESKTSTRTSKSSAKQETTVKGPEIILHDRKRLEASTESKKSLRADKITRPAKQEITIKAPKTTEEKPSQKKIVIETAVVNEPEREGKPAVAKLEPTKSKTKKPEAAQSDKISVPMDKQPAKKQRADKISRPSAKEQKDAAIAKAIAESKSTPAEPRKRQRAHFGFRRTVLALACAAAAVFAIVYFVNQSTPNISLKVAAMQSGIDAKYPSYVPRDYSLSDITSENGRITLNFRNAESGEAFTIVEERSSWDSNALVANYVKDAYGSDYTQISEQGLTIFISGSNACWVNGGVVYKLKTTAGSLTKKQIKAIAVSM